MQIPIVRPWLGQEEIQHVEEVLRSGWLVQGKKVAEFERLVARAAGAEEAVAVSSCTTALHLALRLAGLKCGDWSCVSKEDRSSGACIEWCEVICPSYTFVATVNVLLYLGIKPVLVDIDAQTGNIDPARIEEAITPQTRAIVMVHQLGLPAEIDPISAIAHRHGLAVIEDAACALGAQYKGKPVGSHSPLVCFSFHPRKAVTTAEGGALCTNDPDLAERARILRSHGASVPAEARHQSGGTIYEQYVDVGYNYRMSDVHAAIGIAQMKRLPGILQRRTALASRYTEVFSQTDLVIPPFVPPHMSHAYQTYAVQLSDACSVNRDTVIQRMAERGVSCRRGIPPVHLEPYYIERFGRISLPVTEALSARTLFLPLYPQMTREEQSYVIDSLLHAVR